MIENTSAPRDLWPAPLIIDEQTTVADITRLYERMLVFYIGMIEGEQRMRFTLVSPAFEVFKMHAPQMILERRWKNYQTDEMGDMNVASHGLRQTAITASALRFDHKKLGLTSLKQNLMLAASLLHDLGELKVHDTTYNRNGSSFAPFLLFMSAMATL